MKKSLVIMTVMAVSLAFVGLAFATGPIGCPPPMKMKLVPGKGAVTPPKTITKTDGCMTTCINIPGRSYYEKTQMETVKVPKTYPVMKDLCLGQSKGQCMPCGFCVPVKWECKWQTSMICGEVTEYVTERRPAGKKKFPADCKPEPCTPPPCY
jgi:hypothetical protein